MSPEEYINTLFDFFSVHLRYAYTVLDFYREAHKLTELTQYKNNYPFEAIQEQYVKYLKKVFKSWAFNLKRPSLRTTFKSQSRTPYLMYKDNILSRSMRFIPIVDISFPYVRINMYDIKDNLNENTARYESLNKPVYLKIPYNKNINKDLLVQFYVKPKTYKRLSKSAYKKSYSNFRIYNTNLKLPTVVDRWEKLWLEKYHNKTEYYYNEMMRLLKKIVYYDSGYIKNQMFPTLVVYTSDKKVLSTVEFFNKDRILGSFFRLPLRYLIESVESQRGLSVLELEKGFAAANRTIDIYDCEHISLDKNLIKLEDDRQRMLDRIPSRENFIRYVNSVYTEYIPSSYPILPKMKEVKNIIRTKTSRMEVLSKLYELDWKEFLYLGSIDFKRDCKLSSFIFIDSDDSVKYKDKYIYEKLDHIFTKRTVEGVLETIQDYPMDCLEILKLFWILEKHNY